MRCKLVGCLLIFAGLNQISNREAPDEEVTNSSELQMTFENLIGGFGWREQCDIATTIGCPVSGAQNAPNSPCQPSDGTAGTYASFCPSNQHDLVCFEASIFDYCHDPGAGVCSGTQVQCRADGNSPTGYTWTNTGSGPGCGAFANCD